MKTQKTAKSLFVLLACLTLGLGVAAYGQDSGSAAQAPATVTTNQQTGSDATASFAKVAPGQETTVEGLIVRRNPDSFTLESTSGMFYTVTLNNSTEVKERKSNPFRGSRKYPVTDLLRGLTVEVKGRGDASGALQAQTIKFRNDDLRVAESLQAGINPVEQQLKQAETRLAQAEQNQQRLSGQVEELQAISNAARGGAKAAQDTADSAVKSAEEAKEGVTKTNERITSLVNSLDEYDVKQEVTVNFRAGSAVLSKEAKEQLDKIAEDAKSEKAYVIEVAGFASSDGPDALNQRLSQHRADAVIQYLAENYNIPIRRFVTPIGYGDKQPIADNKTHEGRVQNRRVEVRILTNKGLTQQSKLVASGPADN